MLDAKVKASDYMFKNIQLKDTLNRHKEKLLQCGEVSVQLAFSDFFSTKHFFYIYIKHFFVCLSFSLRSGEITAACSCAPS